MQLKLGQEEGGVFIHNFIHESPLLTYSSSFRSLGDCLSPQTHCYTLEVSFFSYSLQQGATETQVPYTEESCILKADLYKFFMNTVYDPISINFYEFS